VRQEVFELRLVRYVASLAEYRNVEAPQLAYSAANFVCVPGTNGDPGALIRKLSRHHKAETAGAAGDDDGAISKVVPARVGGVEAPAGVRRSEGSDDFQGCWHSGHVRVLSLR
jgi:hypothetical protein